MDWLIDRCDVLRTGSPLISVAMATGSYTAEFGAGVVVNGLDLNTDATKVLVGGRKGTAVFVF